MYVKVQDDGSIVFPYGIGELRRDNPNTSFPGAIPEERLADFGVFPVVPSEIPQPFDAVRQNAVRLDPSFIDGRWTEIWLVSPASPDEIAQRIAEVAQSVRATRQELLSQSDWTQLADVPVDQAKWATYRQALRDITNQPGFPTAVDWPTAP